MPSFGAKARTVAFATLINSVITNEWAPFTFCMFTAAEIFTDDVEYAVLSDQNPADYNIYGYIAKRAHKTPERYNVL